MSLFSQFRKTLFSPVSLSVRHAGTHKSHKPRGKKRRLIAKDKEWVTSGSAIVTQFGLLYHPGLNVGFGRNCTLYAMEHGQVIVTTERMNPDWEDGYIKKFYLEYKDRPEVPLYKNYIHVLPIAMPQKFKLVDQI